MNSVFLNIQQLRSNIIIHLESCFWSFGKSKSKKIPIIVEKELRTGEKAIAIGSDVSCKSIYYRLYAGGER